MRGSSLTYLVKEGVKNVWLNRLMAIASVGVLTACLLIVGTTYLIAENLSSIISFAEKQNEIVVFIKDEATAEQIAYTEGELRAKGNIISVELRTREDVYNEMKEKIDKDNIGIFDGIGVETFPASFLVKIDNMAFLNEVLEDIKKFEIVQVDEIIAPYDIASTIIDIKNTINRLGIIMIGILILVSVVIISNTIRATVYARRTEIGIMRYVGATNSFIRVPFLVEGVILGLISAGLAFFAIQSAYVNITGMMINDSSPFLSSIRGSIVSFDAMSLRLVIYFIVSGVFLGSVGTLISLRSHLRT